jgi:hypothetical protein
VKKKESMVQSKKAGLWGDFFQVESPLNKFMQENYTVKGNGYYLIPCRFAKLFLTHPKAGVTITGSHIFYFKGEKYVMASPYYDNFISHEEVWDTHTGMGILLFMKKYGIVVDPPNKRDHMEISRIFNRRHEIYGVDILKKGLYKNAAFGNMYIQTLKQRLSREKDTRHGLYIIPLATAGYNLREAGLEYGDRNIFYHKYNKYVILVSRSHYEPSFLADHRDIYDGGSRNPLIDFMLDYEIKVRPKRQDFREIERMRIYTRRGHINGVELIYFSF